MTPSQPRGISCRQKLWAMHKERPQMSTFSTLRAKTLVVFFTVIALHCYYAIFFIQAALGILSMVQDQTFPTK